MKIIHTADWHLGHSLLDRSREHEHQEFLNWLLTQLELHQVDALLIAGDVFHTANPSSKAQHQWFDFLALARDLRPSLDIVTIAGNHDSGARLEAPLPLLRVLNMQIVGKVFDSFGPVDQSERLNRMVVPIRNASDEVAALVLAVPYLRPSDLPSVKIEGDVIVEGVRELYQSVTSKALEIRKPHQHLIAMGHCYMSGALLSLSSERKILGANQHALPLDIFDEAISYVALGHLHLAQPVQNQERVRYCGSPIPLSMAEADYEHQVILLELEGDEVSVTPLIVPRTVEMFRVPKAGWATVEGAVKLLKDLPDCPEGFLAWKRSFLEVRVDISSYYPNLRGTVEEALEGKEPRLLKITVPDIRIQKGLADVVEQNTLHELSPEEVFRSLYEKDYNDSPPEGLIKAFHELLDIVQHKEST